MVSPADRSLRWPPACRWMARGLLPSWCCTCWKCNSQWRKNARALPFAQHTVALALVFMVAHQAAHSGEGLFSNRVRPASSSLPSCSIVMICGMGVWMGHPFWHWGALFTVQIAVGFRPVHMDRHGVSPFPQTCEMFIRYDICFIIGGFFRSFSIVLKKAADASQMLRFCTFSLQICPAAAVIFGSRIPQRLTLHVPHSRFVKQMMRPASAKPARR